MGNNSLLRGKGWRMTDEGTKVTLRMGPEVIQMMEDFMDEHDIGNRSDFIRDANFLFKQARTAYKQRAKKGEETDGGDPTEPTEPTEPGNPDGGETGETDSPSVI